MYEIVNDSIEVECIFDNVALRDMMGNELWILDYMKLTSYCALRRFKSLLL